jgi:hypothetical protein
MMADKTRVVRWWVPLAAVAVLAAVGVAVAVVLFVVREDPGAKPVDEAVEDFRSSTGQTGGDARPTGGPQAGVYLLDGEGREAISFPPVEQADGSTMPMTITSGSADCWTLRIDYNEAHWQDWDLCLEGNALMETGGHTWQRWDFGALVVENLSTFVCDPAVPFVVFDARPGAVFERSCAGTNDQVEGTTTSSGTVTVLDDESMDIDGVDVEAMHVRRHNDLTGAQTGTDDVDFWISRADGLPLRGDRSVTVDSDSPVGTITYTEEGTWRLRSTVPER